MWLLAKNPARDTHKCVYKYKTWLLSSLVSASPAYGGKCRALRGDRGKFAYTGQNINTHILCQILHSTPYFFVSLFPIVFYRRSRMTGRFLIPFCKKPFLLSTHACPFRQLRWHFSQGKASHSLLQRRSAPRKAVRLLPVIRGRLAFCILSFYDNNQVIYFKTIISFFLNVSFPRTRREVPSLARR